METFTATKVTDDSIELSSSEQLEKLYNIIDEEQNFILQWTEGSVNHSEVKIANHLRAKVKNGDIKLTSKSGKGGK